MHQRINVGHKVSLHKNVVHSDPFVALVCKNAGRSDYCSSIEPLADLAYDFELAVKKSSFDEFLHSNNIGISSLPILPSPLSRHYRTTSKRRVIVQKDRVLFAFSEIDIPKNGCIAYSVLEPQEHFFLYQQIYDFLLAKTLRSVRDVLTYVIIRGTYDFRYCILNVRKLDATIVRGLKKIALLLSDCGLCSVFAFVDASGSAYYLDENPLTEGVGIKKLFGRDTIRFCVQDIQLDYSLFTFCQINQSIVPAFIKKIDACIPEKREFLFDLFCGFGLFSFTIGKSFRRVYGIDANKTAIENAKHNSIGLGKQHSIRFEAGMITGNMLSRFESGSVLHGETILLDPPRSGAHKSVYEACALRHPSQIIHIMCGTHTLPQTCASWKVLGYELCAVFPCDLFPGTAHVETVAVFKET